MIENEEQLSKVLLQLSVDICMLPFVGGKRFQDSTWKLIVVTVKILT